MSDTLIYILIVVCVFTYAFEIVYGLAGTIMMIVILQSFIPSKSLVVFSLLPQLMVAIIGLWRSPRTVERAQLINMLMFAFIGMLVGMLIFHYLNERLFELLLAIFITACGVYIVTSHDNPRFKKSTLHSLDFTAGMSQQMFGISGPIAMTRIIGSHSDKTVIRNYALAFFLSLNIVRALSYIVVEINSTGWTLFNPQILKAMVIAAPILLITLLVSNQMHFKVRQESFKKILSWVILIGGLYMLIGWFSQ